MSVSWNGFNITTNNKLLLNIYVTITVSESSYDYFEFLPNHYITYTQKQLLLKHIQTTDNIYLIKYIVHLFFII